MTRFNKRFAAFILAAGLAVPATLSRAEDKVPTPGDNTAAKPATDSKLDAADQKFVMAAANGGMAEVKLGQIAQEKGESQAVKDFGKKMVEDHGKANEKLKTLASSKGITLASDITGEEKEHIEKLSKLSGAEFDKAYTADMIKDHRKDISEFRKESKQGQDADVKAFAAETLPTLREHQKMIREVATNSGDADLAKLASEKQRPAKTTEVK